MKRKKMVFGIAIVLIGITLMIWSSTMSQQNIVTELPDGTKVALNEVSFTTNSVFETLHSPARDKKIRVHRPTGIYGMTNQ